jgi:hypothetical protein
MKLKWRQAEKPVEEMTEAELRNLVSALRTSVNLLWALLIFAFLWWLSTLQ